MYRVLENYATMQDNATDEDILHLGKKLQEVEGILNKTNARVDRNCFFNQMQMIASKSVFD